VKIPVPIMRLIMKLVTSKRVRPCGAGFCCWSASTSFELVVVELGAASVCGVMPPLDPDRGEDARDMAEPVRAGIVMENKRQREKVRMAKKRRTGSEQERRGRSRNL